MYATNSVIENVAHTMDWNTIQGRISSQRLFTTPFEKNAKSVNFLKKFAITFKELDQFFFFLLKNYSWFTNQKSKSANRVHSYQCGCTVQNDQRVVDKSIRFHESQIISWDPMHFWRFIIFFAFLLIQSIDKQ